MTAHRLGVVLVLAACGGSSTPAQTTTPKDPVDEVAPPDPVGDPRIPELTARLEAATDPVEIATLHAQLGSVHWELSCPDAVHGLCIRKTDVEVAPRTTCASYQVDSVTSNVEPIARDAAHAAAAVEHFEAALSVDAAPPDALGGARLAMIDRDFEAVFGEGFPRDLDLEHDQAGSLKRFEAWMIGTTQTVARAHKLYKELAVSTPSFRFATLYRRGSLTQWLADQLFHAPVPVSYQPDAELYQSYCDALFDQAEPLERVALDAFRACVAEAKAGGVTGVWPEQCRVELLALDPTAAP